MLENNQLGIFDDYLRLNDLNETKMIFLLLNSTVDKKQVTRFQTSLSQYLPNINLSIFY
jgi:hypothetical protein